jgi:methionine-rich copper-binding protein CopC
MIVVAATLFPLRGNAAGPAGDVASGKQLFQDNCNRLPIWSPISKPVQPEATMIAAIVQHRLSTRGLGLLLAVLALWPCVATARSPHVRDSRPAAEAVIRGRHAEYIIYFDGPVDHAASRLSITQSGRLVQALTPRLDSAVDVLFGDGETPPPGHYFLHWDARSADGDTASGDIPFSVGSR